MLSPVAKISIFQRKPDPKVFSSGATIFEEGQSGDFMYGILAGEVEILVHDKILETIQAGEVFGAGVLVGIKQRNYTAIAKTSCKLAFLNEYSFLFVIQETPMFAIQVMKSYSERLNRIEHSI
ncbi:cyclic nucleotide-binding domain-containing protein [Trichormus azollae]|jgi:CRP-like cAMP-binding protein|uniref:Putative transcriptional regulator, Crp/Fnr family n=1 Tax=Nostoc azollae (strain 0708) TaxID=551115 RepID=D7E3Z5_NOSA0|nr:cyclic nucleotide-binding domain-containing protein [Trichormus azollae]ADI63663.1 putative transcriptional regulator, Crp/Fnr family ['Nostoc azollae' 0708]